jgi:hypothetical protein
MTLPACPIRSTSRQAYPQEHGVPKMSARPIVQPAQPRETAQIHLPDGRIYEAPVGTPLEAFFKAIDFDLPGPIVAAHINCELRELT